MHKLTTIAELIKHLSRYYKNKSYHIKIKKYERALGDSPNTFEFHFCKSKSKGKLLFHNTHRIFKIQELLYNELAAKLPIITYKLNYLSGKQASDVIHYSRDLNILDFVNTILTRADFIDTILEDIKKGAN